MTSQRAVSALMRSAKVLPTSRMIILDEALTRGCCEAGCVLVEMQVLMAGVVIMRSMAVSSCSAKWLSTALTLTAPLAR